MELRGEALAFVGMLQSAKWRTEGKYDIKPGVDGPEISREIRPDCVLIRRALPEIIVRIEVPGDEYCHTIDFVFNSDGTIKEVR